MTEFFAVIQRLSSISSLYFTEKEREIW